MRQEMKAPLLTGLLDWFCYHTSKELQSIKVIEQILPSCGFSLPVNRLGKRIREPIADPV